MADRTTGKPIHLYRSDPWLDELESVTVFDCLNQRIGADDVTMIAPGHFTATVHAPSLQRRDGVWQAVWSDGEVTEFTVGPEQGITKESVILSGIAEVVELTHGRVDAATGQNVTDLRVVGGPGDFTSGWMLFRSPSKAAGMAFRIDEYNGSVFSLVDPVDTLIAAGDRFVITEIDPDEAELALEEVVSLTAPLARVETICEGVVGEQGVLTAPAGWDSISDVYLYDQDGTHRLKHSEWRVDPGRRVVVLGRDADHYTLVGTRDGRMPVWHDSRLDFPGAVLVPFIASKLQGNRARGSATDPDEYMRRSMMSLQKHGALVRAWSGRVPHGARSIL